MKSFTKYKQGVTLIELMVAVTLFVVVSLITTAVVLRLADVNDKGQAITTAMNNLDYALENISRTLRTGYTYDCSATVPPAQPTPNDCASSGSSSISFIDANGDYIQYRLDDGRIMRKKNSDNELSLTAPEIIINTLKFYVSGSSPLDDYQPKVLILADGRTDLPDVEDAEEAEFNVQTTVSQRLSDFALE